MANKLAEIELLSKDYARSYKKLSGAISDMDAEIEAVKNKYSKKFHVCISDVVKRGHELEKAIRKNSECFVSPRTMIFEGIKVGLQKGPVTFQFEDSITIPLIEKHFPEKASVLIQIKKNVVKAAVKTLSDNELKKIAVEKIEGSDTPIIKSVESDKVEKFISSYKV